MRSCGLALAMSKLVSIWISFTIRENDSNRSVICLNVFGIWGLISDVFSNIINNQQICLHVGGWQSLRVVVAHTQSSHIGFFLKKKLFSLELSQNLIFFLMKLFYTALNNIAQEGFVKLREMLQGVCGSFMRLGLIENYILAGWAECSFLFVFFCLDIH